MHSPHAGFHPIFSQDLKDFWAGTTVEGWTFHLKLFSCDFLYAFAKNCSKNRNNLHVKVVAMYNWSNLNMRRYFEPKKTKSSKREPCRNCGKMFKTSIMQSHKRNHTKRSKFQSKVLPSTLVPAQKSFGSWLNIGWNPAWGGCAISFLKFWNKFLCTLCLVWLNASCGS